MLSSQRQERRRGWARAFRSLRVRGIALGVGAILSVMVGTGIVSTLNAGTDSLQEQELRANDVQVEVLHLAVGMDRQQDALRSYATSGDAQYLASYREGRAETQQATGQLAADVPGTGLEAPYARLTPAVAAWQSWADGVSKNVAAGARLGAPGTLDAAAQGQRLFDTFNLRAADMNAAAQRHSAQLTTQAQRNLQAGNVAALLTGPIGIAFLVALLGLLVFLVLQPLTRLSQTAERLAAGERARIPGTRRSDEIGVLARSLEEWVASEGTREAVLEQSPAGIIIMASDGHFLRANQRFCQLTGCSPAEIARKEAGDLIQAEDRARAIDEFRDLIAGRIDHIQMEPRHLRCDGSWFWSNVAIAPVHAPDGTVAVYVAMVEDITERREQLSRAAGIQRGLLPQRSPSLNGYDLAGTCNSAQDVGGDFFDWYESGPDELTFSLGDVMGKGMPAAILMATARAALRTGARMRSIEESAAVAAEALASDLEPLGSFVTLFHARLEEASGEVSFVDAGHGLAAVVHPNGSIQRLSGTDFPVGIMPGHRYSPSRVQLEPGDALVVFSDGVLDVHPELEKDLGGVGRLVSGAETAGEIVERLASPAPGSPADDVTVLALRRQAPAPLVSAVSSSPAASESQEDR